MANDRWPVAYTGVIVTSMEDLLAFGFGLRIQTVWRYLVIERRRNVRGADGGHLDSGIKRRRANMRCQYDVGHFREPARKVRLLLKDVKTSASNVTFA